MKQMMIKNKRPGVLQLGIDRAGKRESVNIGKFCQVGPYSETDLAASPDVAHALRRGLIELVEQPAKITPPSPKPAPPASADLKVREDPVEMDKRSIKKETDRATPDGAQPRAEKKK